MTPVDGFADTPFGRIHYLEQGRGPALLMLHSNGASAHEYRPAMALLSQPFRVIAWDMPGQGDSEPLTRHMTMADYSRAAMALLDALSIKSATVLGSSVGSSIAADVALSHPDRVDAAVIVEIPLGRDGAWWEANWTMVERMFSIPQDSFEAVSRRYKALTPQGYDRLMVDRHKAGRAMMDVMWAGRAWSDRLEEILSSISIPVLFLLGEKGVAAPVSDRFLKLAPAASLTIIPDCGHFPLTDDVEASVAAILAFSQAQVQALAAPRPGETA